MSAKRGSERELEGTHTRSAVVGRGHGHGHGGHGHGGGRGGWGGGGWGDGDTYLLYPLLEYDEHGNLVRFA